MGAIIMAALPFLVVWWWWTAGDRRTEREVRKWEKEHPGESVPFWMYDPQD